MPNSQPSASFAPKFDACASDFRKEATWYVLDASLNEETLDAATQILNVKQLPSTIIYSAGKEKRRFLGGGNKKLRWALASELAGVIPSNDHRCVAPICALLSASYLYALAH